MIDVSVVVPTYCRDVPLRRTLTSIAASDREGYDRLEILLVDDGSQTPAERTLAGVLPGLPVPTRIVRQENAGPGAARNRGFRESLGRLVLFVDDDIEVPRGLVSAHVMAHARYPDAVIFGHSVLPPGGDPTLRAVLDSCDASEGVEFEPSPVVASGNLSAERALFPSGVVYRSELRTPAAEELELSVRLRARGIPILRANHIRATHLVDLSLRNVCRQQYTHGRGLAEAAVRAPETLTLPEVHGVVSRTSGTSRVRTDLPRRMALSRAGRWSILSLARAAGRARARSPATVRLYSWAIAAHFLAGVREGLKEFGFAGVERETSPREARKENHAE